MRPRARIGSITPSREQAEQELKQSDLHRKISSVLDDKAVMLREHYTKFAAEAQVPIPRPPPRDFTATRCASEAPSTRIFSCEESSGRSPTPLLQ